VSRDAQSASKSIQEFAQANGQILLPLVELITQVRVAVDDVIQSIGRQTIETILTLSAQELAGTRAPGKRRRSLLTVKSGERKTLPAGWRSPIPSSTGSKCGQDLKECGSPEVRDPVLVLHDPAVPGFDSHLEGCSPLDR